MQSSDAFAKADRLSACADRRSSGVPHRVRQDRCPTSRSTRSPISAMPIAVSAPRSIPATRCRAQSEVIGLKENSSRKTGIVYVRTTGYNQDAQAGAGICALGDGAQTRRSGAGAGRSRAAPADRARSEGTRRSLSRASTSPAYDVALAGSPTRFGDYEVGEKIDHVDGITVEEAEHHDGDAALSEHRAHPFRPVRREAGPLRRRLIYGGHVISLARALSFNGFANAFHVAAINGGRHVAPLFAGGTVFAWSEVLAKAELPGRGDVGALRLRTVATSDQPCGDFPLQDRRRLRSRRCCSIWIIGC